MFTETRPVPQKITTKQVPHKCPVCEGHPPYVGENVAAKGCKSCNDTGIIYTTETTQEIYKDD